jgi:hypothetical protein
MFRSWGYRTGCFVVGGKGVSRTSRREKYLAAKDGQSLI